jgi:hypothetical protein
MDQLYRTCPTVDWTKSKPVQVRARERLRSRTSETTSQIQDGRIRDLGLGFEVSETRVQDFRDPRVRGIRDLRV